MKKLNTLIQKFKLHISVDLKKASLTLMANDKQMRTHCLTLETLFYYVKLINREERECHGHYKEQMFMMDNLQLFGNLHASQ